MVHAEIRMRAVREADRGGGATDLFHCDDMREIAQARAAALLLDSDAEQTKRAQIGPKLGREAIIAIDMRSERRDTIARKLCDARSQRVEVVAKTEIEIHHLFSAALHMQSSF